MNIYVCVGSSCHLKGSYDVIQLIQQELYYYKLEDKVNLSAACCLGKCKDGVTMKVNNELICGVSKDNFSMFFKEHVLSHFK